MAQTIRTYVTPHPTGGSGALDVEVIPDGPGTVSFATTGWTPGTYTITCTRQPDGDSESSASNAISWTLNAAAPTTSFSDDFNRADGALASPWADAYNRLGNRIVGNRMVRNAAAGSKSELPTYAFTGDHFIQARCSYADTLAIISSTAPGTSGDSCGVRVTNDGFNDLVTLYRMVGGTYTSLQTAGMTLAAGDPWVRLEVRGADNFRVLTSTDGATWTTRINYTDATPLSNRGVPGFELGGVDGWIDDVSIGAL